MLITWQDLLDFFFPTPQKCPFCLEKFLSARQEICSSCREKISFIPLPENWQEGCLGFYEGLLQEIIHKLKYQGQVQLAEPLGGLLAEHLKGNWTQVEGLIPIPLHTKRLQKRGFNQVQLIAAALGRNLGLAVWSDLLVRIRDTASQVELGRKERLKNLTGAFQLVQPQLVKNKRLLLLDDVLTTGATTTEAKKVLLKAGATEVKILVVARGKVSAE